VFEYLLEEVISFREIPGFFRRPSVPVAFRHSIHLDKADASSLLIAPVGDFLRRGSQGLKPKPFLRFYGTAKAMP
jgi:hypothetical protein